MKCMLLVSFLVLLYKGSAQLPDEVFHEECNNNIGLKICGPDPFSSYVGKCTSTIYWSPEEDCYKVGKCCSKGKCVVGECDVAITTTDTTTTSTTTTTQQHFACSGNVGPTCDPNTDCRFHFCQPGGSSSVLDCPINTHYDDEVKACVDGTCSSSSSGCKPAPTTTTTQATSTTESPFACSGNVGPTCDPNTDCRFHFCQPGGSSSVLDCPINTHYDDEVKACVDGTCSSSSSGCKPAPTTTTTQATSTTESPFACSGNVGPTCDPNTDCRFHFCQPGGSSSVLDCPINTHYDDEVKACVDGTCSSSSSGCKPAPTTTTTQATSTTESPFACSGNVGPTCDPNTDCRFHFCQPGGSSSVLNCPENTHYDDEVKACVVGACGSETSGCKLRTTTTTQHPFSCDGNVGPICNPNTDCSFYYCYAEGSYTEMKCNAAFHYDDYSKKCIPGSCTGNSACKTSTTTAIPSTCSGNVGPVCSPNTNCVFIYCYADGTFQEFHCNTNSHYEDSSKKCVPGACSPDKSGCGSRRMSWWYNILF